MATAWSDKKPRNTAPTRWNGPSFAGVVAGNAKAAATAAPAPRPLANERTPSEENATAPQPAGPISAEQQPQPQKQQQQQQHLQPPQRQHRAASPGGLLDDDEADILGDISSASATANAAAANVIDEDELVLQGSPVLDHASQHVSARANGAAPGAPSVTGNGASVNTPISSAAANSSMYAFRRPSEPNKAGSLSLNGLSPLETEMWGAFSTPSSASMGAASMGSTTNAVSGDRPPRPFFRSSVDMTDAPPLFSSDLSALTDSFDSFGLGPRAPTSLTDWPSSVKDSQFMRKRDQPLRDPLFSWSGNSGLPFAGPQLSSPQNVNIGRQPFLPAQPTSPIAAVSPPGQGSIPSVGATGAAPPPPMAASAPAAGTTPDDEIPSGGSPRPSPSPSVARGNRYGQRIFEKRNSISKPTVRHATSPRGPLLEEFRSSKKRSWRLKDLRGHVVEFCVDQLGSRFIQQRLDTASDEERRMVYEEALPHLLELSSDVFANYVVQKLIEQGTPEQHDAIVTGLLDNIPGLSMQMYGCRVVQRAVECSELSQRIRITNKMHDHVFQCARDAQSNHVIQRILECMPPEHTLFITSKCAGQASMLATHPHGCRVLQRIFENCVPAQTRPLLDELIADTDALMCDQYGNYVIQWIVESGHPSDRDQVLLHVYGHLVDLARQKFASNVIEKCILAAGDVARDRLLDELLAPPAHADSPSAVRILLSDSFGNYPLQKFLMASTGDRRARLFANVSSELAQLRRVNAVCSKHLVAVERILYASASH